MSKYYKVPLGAGVGNGKLFRRFTTEVVKVDDKDWQELLDKAKSAKELTEEEAKKLCPFLFENDEKPTPKKDVKKEEPKVEVKKEEEPKVEVKKEEKTTKKSK